MSGQGPYWGQKAWFDFYHPEKVPSAVERYSNEIRRTIQVIDKHLADHGTGYLVGDRVTYADLMFLPWCAGLPIRVAPEIDTSEWAHYNAWLERLLARPVAGKVIAAWKVEIQKGTG